jgi:hypothetical protein
VEFLDAGAVAEAEDKTETKAEAKTEAGKEAETEEMDGNNVVH